MTRREPECVTSHRSLSCYWFTPTSISSSGSGARLFLQYHQAADVYLASKQSLQRVWKFITLPYARWYHSQLSFFSLSSRCLPFIRFKFHKTLTFQTERHDLLCYMNNTIITVMYSYNSAYSKFLEWVFWNESLRRQLPTRPWDSRLDRYCSTLSSASMNERWQT